jgi:hypothetical protein
MFFHLLCRGPTPFERRFHKEFEESLIVLVETVFVCFESFLRMNTSTRMHGIPHLHVSMPNVEKFTDLLVLLLPIFPLTSPGTVQGGLTSSAVLEHDLRRRHGATDDADLGHD